MRFLLSLLTLLVLATPAHAQNERRWPTDLLKETYGVSRPEQIDVPIKNVIQGCPKQNCIPSIDQPKFLAAGDSGTTADEDLVMAVELGGEKRAYPIYILNSHEVVNDAIGELAFAVTWCPLCGSGLVFDRRIDGKPVKLGVSGLLHNSDLILYDHDSNSLWQQITGRAMAGKRRGQTLKNLPVTLTTWGQWRKANPDTRLLSTDTGFDHDYSEKQPYGDYATNDRLMFPASGASAGLRLHPKAVVFGVELGKDAVAVSERALLAEGQVAMTLGKVALTFTRKADGRVQVTRADGQPAPIPHRVYWFAWASFHSGTVLYDPQGLPKAKP